MNVARYALPAAVGALTFSGWAAVAAAQFPYIVSPQPCRVRGAAAGDDPERFPLVRGSVAVLALNDGGAGVSPDDDTPLVLAEGVRDGLRSVGIVVHNNWRAEPRVRSAAGGDPQRLGRALGAQYVLGGRVRRTATGVSGTLELWSIDSARVLWRGDYTAVPSQLLTMRNAVVAEVGRRVRSATARGTRNQPATTNPAAYEAFARGNYYAVQDDARALVLAAREYETAVSRDPTFEPALARVARTYAALAAWEWGSPSGVRLDAARRGLDAAERALRQNPRSTDAMLAQGALLQLAGSRTLAPFTRAIAIDPRNADPHYWYGLALLRAGSMDAGERELRRAVALEPEHAGAMVKLAELAHNARQDASACQLLNTAIRTDPRVPAAYLMRALVRMRLGDLRLAYADAETATRVDATPFWGQAVGAVVSATARDTASARETADRLARQVPAAPAVLGVNQGKYLAMALVAGGRRDRAVEVLARTGSRGPQLTGALRAPELDPIRRAARFPGWSAGASAAPAVKAP